MVGATHEQITRLPQFVSIYTAECYALWMAVRYIISSKHKKAVIFTDSLSALKSLNYKSQYEPFIGDILNMLSHTPDDHTIRLCWVPSHVGIPGNERADQLAATAKEMRESKTNIPARDGIQAVRRATTFHWQQEWKLQQNNKLHLIKPVLGEWKTCLHQARFIEVVICRLRIGHTHITHNYLLAGEEAPTCDKCQEQLTVMHILIACPHMETLREKHFRMFYRLNIPFHPMLLLGDDALIPIADVISFYN